MTDSEHTYMNTATNTLTIIIGCLTTGFAVLGNAVGFLLVLPWFPVLIGCLGGIASLIGICKTLHEWRLGIRRAKQEDEVHRLRMSILLGTNKMEGKDAD